MFLSANRRSPPGQARGQAFAGTCARDGRSRTGAGALVLTILQRPMTESAIPSRLPDETPAEDAILPFEVASLDLRGRVLRLGDSLDGILGAHDYPVPVAKLLGEAIVLTVLLGSSLKFEGRFILQTQTDGLVRMLVVDYASPGRIRACARYNASEVAAAIAEGRTGPAVMIGRGHLAMTIDRGPET